jgi:hypothetical protein
MITSKYQSSRLQTILLQIILASMIIGTILAFAVVVIITQLETNAATASTSLSSEQTQTNKCSSFVPCGNTGTIVFPLEPGHGGHGHGWP